MDREERYQRRMEMKSIDVTKYQWRRRPQKKLYLSSSESTTEESENEDFSKRKNWRSESKPTKRFFYKVRDVPLRKRSKIVISSDSEEENEKENVNHFHTRNIKKNPSVESLLSDSSIVDKPAGKRSNKVYVTSSESDSEVIIGKKKSSTCRKKNPVRRYSPSDFEPQKPRTNSSRIIISSDEEEEENKLGFWKERTIRLKPESLIIPKPVDDKAEDKFEHLPLKRKKRTRIIKKSYETDPIVDPSTISLFNLEILPNKPQKKRETKNTEVKLTQPLTYSDNVLEEFENERTEPNYDELMNVNIPVFNYNDYDEQEVPTFGKVDDGYIFDGFLSKEEENNFFNSYKIENVTSPIDDSFLEFFNNDTATVDDLMSNIRISLEMTM